MEDTQTSTMALGGTPTTPNRTRTHFASRQNQENDTTKQTMEDTQTSTMALAGTPTTTNLTRSQFARRQDQENDTTEQTMEDTQTSTMALPGKPKTTNRIRSQFARHQNQDNDTTKQTMEDTQTSTMALPGTPKTTNRTRSQFARRQALADTPTTTKRTRSHFARRQEPQDVDVLNFLEGSDTGKSADPHDSSDEDFTDDGSSTNNNNKKRTRSQFACRPDPQDVEVQNFLECSDTGTSGDPRDSSDDDFTDDGQRSTKKNNPKRTRSQLACRQDPQDGEVQNFLEGSDSGSSADPCDSSHDDFTDDGQHSTNNNNKCVRRRYSICRKLWTIRKVEQQQQENGLSLRQACDSIGIHHSLLVRWRKQKARLTHIPNPSVKSTHIGMASTLKQHEEVLLRYIFELREQGIQVSLGMVVLKASSLSRSFKEKTNNAKEKIVARFVARHGLKHRMGTHESQRDPRETSTEALDYMQHVRVKLAQPNRHADYIINMDQTPIPFTFNSKRTLEKVGKKTVHIRKSTNDTKRATLALTVTASGKMIRPMLIFKGTANGRIVKRDMPGWDHIFLYACQPNAWMDERCMLLWVELCLKPHVATSPTGIIPILFLDSYRCHMMASVVDAIQELGVEVELIPGGCTCLCQPVDVGINKPFKKRICDLWQTWMMGDMSEGTTTVTVGAPTRELIRDWCIDAYKQMQSETTIIKNAWRHGEYTWFAGGCALPPTNEVQLENMATVASDNGEDDDETLTESCPLPPTNEVQLENMATVAIDNGEDDDETLTETLTENDRQPSPGTSVALAQLLDESSDEEDKADTARLYGN